jgi:serine/threonine protein kinase
MSIDRNHPDYIDLRSRIRENPKDFVVIVGAGLSRPCGLPSWGELRDKLVENALHRTAEVPEAEAEGYKAKLHRISEEKNLWNCFAELQEILPGQAYQDCIRSSLTLADRKAIPLSYDLLWQLDIKGIVSYNLDTCPTDSYSKVRRCAVDTATARDTARFPQFLVGAQQFVFQPHGHIADPSTWVFTHRERAQLLGSVTYTDFIRSLCSTKHLLILGFDPEDFAFEYLIQRSLVERSTTGAKHYILFPRTDPAFVKKFGDLGFAVVPYDPSDPVLHPEVEQALRDFLSFSPADDIPASVFTGDRTELSELPTDDELLRIPIQEARRLLNGAIASIIPPDKTPDQDDIDKLEEFYHRHLKVIHMAWLIEPDSEFDVVHGYKIVGVKARGAFGQVYETENLDTHSRAALKVLLPEVRNSREYLNSFRRGVRSMRILTRRGIEKMVRIIDAYEVPACVFMEYIDGPTLTEAKRWGLLDSMTQCLDVLVQVGEVVHLAHNLEERVLHRDLKPDNVILRGRYRGDDPLDVVVLDFDLSWHKGASDMSVVHGARAQGYAAPEQTATGMKAGVSTRHTGVDVFGYGMLAYFVFTGDDPKPNEQNFKDFEGRVIDRIRRKFSCGWQCLPSYLARTIVECTYDSQRERMAFASAVEAFREAHKMTLSDAIGASNPLILEEIAAIVAPDSKVVLGDFRRNLKAGGADSSKQLDLKLESEGENAVIAITLSKVRSGSDNRFVPKYLDKAKDKALSKLRASPFRGVRGEIGQSRLDVHVQWPLGASVTRMDIEGVSNRLFEAQCLMTLG